VAELLDHVQRGDERRFSDFCEALEKCGQKNVVDKYLKCCGRAGDAVDAVISHDPNDMPLSRMNARKLAARWNYLIDTIVSDANFFANLHCLQVFTDLQIQKLKASVFLFVHAYNG